MKICPNCNRENSDDALFCNYCGKQFTISQEVEYSNPITSEGTPGSSQNEDSKNDAPNQKTESSNESAPDVWEQDNLAIKKKKKKTIIIAIVLFIVLSVLTIVGLKLYAILKTNSALEKGIDYYPVKIVYEKQPFLSKDTGTTEFGVTYLKAELTDKEFKILTYDPSQRSVYNSMKDDLLEEAMKTGTINAVYIGHNAWESPYEYYPYYSEEQKAIDWEWVSKERSFCDYSSTVSKIKYKWAWNWKDFEVILSDGITVTTNSPFDRLSYEEFWSQYNEDDLIITGIDRFEKTIDPEIPKGAIGFFFPPATPRNDWQGAASYNFFWYQNFYETIDEAISYDSKLDETIDKAPGLWYWDYVFKYGYLDKKITKDSKGNDIKDDKFEYWHVVIPAYKEDEEFIFKCKKNEPFAWDYENSWSIPIEELEKALPYFHKESVIPGAKTRIVGFIPEPYGISGYYLSNGKTIYLDKYKSMQELTTKIKDDSLRIKIADSILNKQLGEVSVEEDLVWVQQYYDYDDVFHLYCGYWGFTSLRGYINIPDEFIKENSKINSITIVSGFDEIKIDNNFISQKNDNFTIGDTLYRTLYADFFLGDNYVELESMLSTGDLSVRIDIDGKLESFIISEEDIQNMEELIKLYKEFKNNL